MGAGCTISSSNKTMISMQVVSPQKKGHNPKENSRATNLVDQSDMLSVGPNRKIIDEKDFSPRMDDLLLKKYQIGKYFSAHNSPVNSFWRSYLLGTTNDEEALTQLRDLYKKSPKFFSSKLEKFGAPEHFRWESWYLVSGNGYPSSVLEEKNLVNRLYYETISGKECKCEEDIKKDIFRTFPKHPFFNEIEEGNENDVDQRNVIGAMNYEMGNLRLLRLLKAIANQYPQVGYCQGMNFLFGFFLGISGGKESQVFQFAQKLVEAPKIKILGFYDNGFPLLKLYCYIFYKILNKKNKKLSLHLKSTDLPDSLWLTKWMLTMLVLNFPFEISLRMWDFIIGNENLFNLIKICVVLIGFFEKHIIHKDANEIAELFREIIDKRESLNDTKSPLYINPEVVVQRAKKIKLTEKMIGKFTKEYINSLERDEEKQNEYLLFYREFGTTKQKAKKGKKEQNVNE